MKEPKIRLKGFSGEWETRNIASVASLKAGSSIDTSQEISYPSQGYYPCYGGNGLRGYVRDYTHDGIYNIIGRQGALCGNVKMATGKFHATEHAVVVTPTKQLDPYFLFNVLTKSNINQYATGVAQPGLSVQNVNKSLFINIPDFDEQQALGAYFQHLDSLIQSTTKKIESLKQVKAASLQSMFPQEGETTPRVRFKGFEGEWERALLGSLFAERCEYDINAEMLSVSQSQGIIKASDNGRFDNSNSDKSKYKLVRINDIAYNSMRMWQGACGCSPYEGIVSPAYTVVTPKDNVYSKFFFYMFKTNQMLKIFRLNSQGLTSDTWNLKYPSFSKLQICYPTSIEEQKKIADYFTNLDSQISLQTQRLEKLKQIKSACLDNMFV